MDKGHFYQFLSFSHLGVNSNGIAKSLFKISEMCLIDSRKGHFLRSKTFLIEVELYGTWIRFYPRAYGGIGRRKGLPTPGFEKKRAGSTPAMSLMRPGAL